MTREGIPRPPEEEAFSPSEAHKQIPALREGSDHRKVARTGTSQAALKKGMDIDILRRQWDERIRGNNRRT